MPLIPVTQTNDRMIKIGIIDTGVDIQHHLLRHAKISGVTLYREENWSVKIKDNFFCDSKGHGTGVVSIINQYAPGVEFIVVKLDSFDGVVTEGVLIDSIHYLIDHSDVKIINISMGVRGQHSSPEMELVCENAAVNDITIVAADYHTLQKNKNCFPANIDTVYGVRVGHVSNDRHFRYLDQVRNLVLAKGNYKKVAAPGNNFFMAYGTSFAAASFTGIIARAYLDDYWETPMTLKQWLQANTDNSIIEAVSSEHTM